MLQPGEKIVAAAPFRDYVLVFGEHGTVIRVMIDENTGQLDYQIQGGLGCVT